MDLNEIKEIIKADGGKFIIVENDRPEFVIMSFDDFKKSVQKKREVPTNNSNPAVAERKETYSIPENTNQIPKELEDEPLRIEDIPF